MFELFVVALLVGGAGYFFLKKNTERGADTVRAYIFMSDIETGLPVEIANRNARGSASSLSEAYIRLAKHHVDSQYQGKQLPFLADAEAAGFDRMGARQP
ncbi:hypothetical protein K1W69_18375 [Hoeflea sp. WL0058]|uniref:Uncharacterized protein n=1 Tax=Flavimaribacter sediminis TaxID=2865987 RepID=A0AAE2ZM76_9HYPH|nr:hypothetical protein [Flavimaribacter sediminis]MBW8639168.1 hypothetical protein [Flavimaribacter sediminis]